MHLRILKVYSPFIIVSAGLTVLPALAILHGSVAFEDCIPFVFLYSLDVVSLILFETATGCLLACGATDVLRFNGIIGMVLRIPFVLIVHYAGLGLVGFALAAPLDFLCRGVYSEVMLRRLCKKENTV